MLAGTMDFLSRAVRTRNGAQVVISSVLCQVFVSPRFIRLLENAELTMEQPTTDTFTFSSAQV